jgi:beta-lactamase superfamily II metal-dependent hydrolase
LKETMRHFLWMLFIVGWIACGVSVPSSNVTEPNISVQKDNLSIIIIDVGQGDATLVITPSHHAMLIDGGPKQAGVSRVLPDLSKWGVESLDFLFVSHYDADHIGGISEIVAGADQISGNDDDILPNTTYDGGFQPDTIGDVFLDYLTAIDKTRATLRPGDKITYPDGVTVSCSVINGETATGKKIVLPPEDDNGRSMGLVISYGAFRYFTSGDLTGGGPTGSQTTQNVEDLVAPEIGSVDVLHVNHHGSATSSSATFLQTLLPTVSVISVGKDNSYGHPLPEVLWRLHQVGSTIYQTEAGFDGSPASDVITNGDIVIKVNKKDYSVAGDTYSFKNSPP